MDASLECAAADEVSMAINIINERIDWQNANGIAHWNKEEYLTKHFPEQYFRNAQQEGRLYFLKHNGRHVATATVWEKSTIWGDCKLPKAYYLKNIASVVQPKGYGELLIQKLVEKAERDGVEAIRVDVLSSSRKLLEYYKKLGFTQAGEAFISSVHLTKLQRWLGNSQ